MANDSDPMSFMKNLWGGNGFTLPGMVTPSLDTDDLEKRITDLKTVEGWLRTNLSMLSMTIQNMEMQRSTLTAVRTMSQMYANQAGTAPADAEADASAPEGGAAMWPWTMMQQMQASMQDAAAQAQQAAAERSAAAPGKAAPQTARTATAKAAASEKASKSAGKKKPRQA